jgi:hypothetical protein
LAKALKTLFNKYMIGETPMSQAQLLDPESLEPELYRARLKEARIVFEVSGYSGSATIPDWSMIEVTLAPVVNREEVFKFFEDCTILSVIRFEDKLYVVEHSYELGFPLLSTLTLWVIPLEVIKEVEKK